MKTLIVDDELVSRTKLRKILTSAGECVACSTGQEAVKEFEKSLDANRPFDLVTLDVSLVGMDGISVLFILRNEEKKRRITREGRAKVFMVTSHSGHDTVVNSIHGGCDGYIVKPFNRAIIQEQLVKVGLTANGVAGDDGIIRALNETQTSGGPPPKGFEEVIDSFRSGRVNLPAVPQISKQFREMLDRSAPFEEFADLLHRDIAISSKIIAVSNSAWYRGAEPNKTLVQAMNRLGLESTRQYVDVICNHGLYVHRDPACSGYLQRLWLHSLATAYAAQEIAKRQRLNIAGDPFTLGLLHDIGKSVLLQVIGEMNIKKSFGQDFSFNDIISELDAYHGEIGAALFKRWRYPNVYLEVARNHCNISEITNPSTELLITHLANDVAKAIGFEVSPSDLDLDLPANAAVRQLAVSEKNLTEICEATLARTEEIKSIFSS